MTTEAEARLEIDLRILRSLSSDQLLVRAEQLLRDNRQLGQTLNSAAARIAELENREALSVSSRPWWCGRGA